MTVSSVCIGILVSTWKLRSISEVRMSSAARWHANECCKQTQQPLRNVQRHWCNWRHDCVSRNAANREKYTEAFMWLVVWLQTSRAGFGGRFYLQSCSCLWRRRIRHHLRGHGNDTFICLSLCPSSLSLSLSLCLSLYLSLCLSLPLPLSLSLSLFLVSMSVFMSVFVSICLYLCLYLYFPLCMSVSVNAISDHTFQFQRILNFSVFESWLSMTERGLTLLSMASHDLSLLSMASHGLSLLSMASHGLSWLSMASHGLSLLSMASHGLSLLSMASHGLAQLERKGLSLACLCLFGMLINRRGGYAAC